MLMRKVKKKEECYPDFFMGVWRCIEGGIMRSHVL